jgi:hypothetical protein
MLPMTKARHIGQLDRRTALRKRQQAFLRALVECSGSRVRAVEASGIPLGTVLRWQSDPWFAERYEEIRSMLASDAQALRADLMEKCIATALGEYRGLAKPAALRRILDGLDAAEDRLASSAELDAQIRELLRR